MQSDEIRDQAIALFERGDYRDAFISFTKLYNNSGDEQEREMIFQILEEGYYQPNKEDMGKRYDENCVLLNDYPFQLGFRKCPYASLPVQLFPVSGTEYSLFYKEEKTFSELRSITSDQLQDYLFQDLSRPIFRENDCNLYHMQYLQDNVRRSEDFGGDNHIYLYFDGLSELAPLLLLGELGPILSDQKFVFLIGRKNRKEYPIDFKKRFQIDYAAMGPQPIRIEEIKRICFWYQKSHCGAILSLATLEKVTELQPVYTAYFHAYSTINGKNIQSLQEFKTKMSDVNHCYSAEEVEKIFHSEKYDLKLDAYTFEQMSDMALTRQEGVDLGGREDYLNWLRRDQKMNSKNKYTIKELFCAYGLWQYEKRNLNPRVVPILIFDPHMRDPSLYGNLVCSFPYYTCLTSVRNPIMVLARNYNTGMVGGNQFDTQLRLASDYVYAQFLDKRLQSCYYGFRFEDLKTKPEVVCRAVCKHLNVPYEPQMLEADAPWPDMPAGGKITRGFDTAALHRDISPFLSEFDQLRLKMFYAPILDYYGYPSFSFKEHPLPERLVRELLKYPFRFEYINHMRFEKPPSWDELHSWLQEILQGALGKQFVVPQMIPLEEQADG